MTTILLESVGLCAHYSKQGDWAFDVALSLAKERNIQLNIFYFLEDPYGLEKALPTGLSREERGKIIVEKERKLRFYYDERLGEHLKAGFRVCEDREWTELRRCLIRREFQLIIVPHLSENTTFGGQHIVKFAYEFGAPMMLVGPHHPDEIHLNQPARMISDQLQLPGETWQLIGAKSVEKYD